MQSGEEKRHGKIRHPKIRTSHSADFCICLPGAPAIDVQGLGSPEAHRSLGDVLVKLSSASCFPSPSHLLHDCCSSFSQFYSPQHSHRTRIAEATAPQENHSLCPETAPEWECCSSTPHRRPRGRDYSETSIKLRIRYF